MCPMGENGGSSMQININNRYYRMVLRLVAAGMSEERAVSLVIRTYRCTYEEATNEHSN